MKHIWWLWLAVLSGVPSLANAAGVFECKLESAREILAAGSLDASTLSPGHSIGIALVPEYPEFGLTGTVDSFFTDGKQMLRLSFFQDGRFNKENLLELSDVDPVNGARLSIRMVNGAAIHSYYLACSIE